MIVSLGNQTIVITGGAKRLGRAIALECARAGANVAFSFRNSRDESAATLAELQATSPQQQFAAYELEVSDANAVDDFAARVQSDFGRVDGLVNCAAIFRRTPFESLSESDFDAHIGANLKGPFLLCRAFGAQFLAQGSGAIVNFSDVFAQKPLANYIPYCASKAGIEMLTKGFAKSLAPHVRVNCIAPGAILPGDGDEVDEAELLRRVPLGRLGTPDEIASCVIFLLGGPQFITGAILPVDGGQLLR